MPNGPFFETPFIGRLELPDVEVLAAGGRLGEFGQLLIFAQPFADGFSWRRDLVGQVDVFGIRASRLGANVAGPC